jgi:HNH endonuclease
MELVWPHRRCILCCREHDIDRVPFSQAHLIPESIGGFAWAWTKCKECNEQVGHSIESAVVKDDGVRIAIDNLRSQLPELARKFDRRTRWIADTANGLIEARWREGAFDLLTAKDEESGARRQSKERARAGLAKRLQREQRGDAEIEAALALFDAAESGVPFDIYGETFEHGTVGSGFRLPLDGAPVSDAFPSLIAFHFLALSLGESVYDARLNTLRKAIRQGEPQSDWHVAESGFERRYVPEHLVGFAQCEPHVVVRVQLFGWSVWRVHFPRLASRSEPIGLRFDLQRKTIALGRPRLIRPLASPPEG